MLPHSRHSAPSQSWTTMAFSTDSPLLHAWRIEDCNHELAAKRLGCAPAEATRELAKLRARLADRSQLDALLDKLPAPSLAVLSLLAAHDGLLVEDDLIAAARTRFALERADVVPGVAALLQQLLVVELSGPWHAPAVALV